MAGPILRASLLLPQIARKRVVSVTQLRDGLWLVAWGYFKKIFVADNLARMADDVFRSGGDPTGLQVLLGLYAFAFQIYGDFSGYTDIARGTSKLMGIELSVNFRFPYFVRTPSQFWQHWHISLSEWLRDYIFLPLSYRFSRRLDGVRWLGVRDDFWIYAAATMSTMLAAGLWSPHDRPPVLGDAAEAEKVDGSQPGHNECSRGRRCDSSAAGDVREGWRLSWRREGQGRIRKDLWRAPAIAVGRRGRRRGDVPPDVPRVAGLSR